MSTDLKVEKIRNAGLNISLGCKLSIQVEGIKERFSSFLVGMLADSYLIIAHPSKTGKEDIFTKGNSVLVRYLYLGEVFGFQSTILSRTTSPFMTLFLSYPEAIERVSLRKKQRIDCYIPATLRCRDLELQGIVENLSSDGCKVTTLAPKQADVEQISIGEDAQISFPVFGLEGIQTLNGTIRNMNLDGKSIGLGVSFAGMDTKVSDSIDSYIKSVTEFIGSS